MHSFKGRESQRCGFLTRLGFVGPKEEAEEIKQRLRTFLQEELKLELSEAKTLITHARTETARFLNYEIHTLQENAHRDHRDRRTLNGTIGLCVPREVIKNKCQSYKRYSRKVQHRTELINDSDFTIMALYQAEYRGLVEYYRLAYNLHSLTELEGTMEVSLTKTLAAKYKVSVPKVYKKYQTTFQDGKKCYKVLQVLIEREGKKPLVARWGGISRHRSKIIAYSLVQVDQSWKRGSLLTGVNTVARQETPSASRCMCAASAAEIERTRWCEN